MLVAMLKARLSLSCGLKTILAEELEVYLIIYTKQEIIGPS